MRRPTIVTIAFVGFVGFACATALPVPDLGDIYNRAAQQDDLSRNPIIVIPGVLGSRLEDPDGRVVWGAFGGNYANPRQAEGRRLVALPMALETPLSELRDEVEAVEVLDRVQVTLLRLPVEQKAYYSLLGALGAGGYRDQNLGLAGAIDYGDDHYTCFQFAYDWRRDIAESARRLHEFILEKEAYVLAEDERRFGQPRENLRFDIVAHSMGGLVTRYYLRHGPAPLPDDGSLPPLDWAGAERVERAILVATPNAGSIEGLMNLVEGADFSWLLPGFPPAVLGTMPSLYQLLPRPRHGAVVYEGGDGERLDLYDPAVWDANGWGLLDPGQADVLADLLPDQSASGRLAVAREHVARSLARAQQLHRALDRPAAPPPELSLHLIAGDAEPTASRLAVSDDGAIRVAAYGPGDGTVLRSSAVLDERVGGTWTAGLRSPIAWDRVTFLFQDHLGLTRDPAFTDNLLYLLLEEPRTPLDPEESRTPVDREESRTPVDPEESRTPVDPEESRTPVDPEESRAPFQQSRRADP